MASQIADWVSNPSENHGPLMSITTWILTGVAFAFLVLRLCIRQLQGKLWLDDLVLGGSWALLLSQMIINQLTINMGFGRHSFDINFSYLDKIAYFGATGLSISIFAITLSKISFGFTLLRLTDGWTRYWVYYAMGSLLVFAIPAAVIPWVQCKPLTKTFVDLIPGTCINKHPSVVYGRFQAVYSALMDVSLALLPWKILWGLQMRTAEKIGVCIAMSLGILAGVAAIIRARYVELLTKEDLSYDAYNSVIWSVAETAMTIVATSMPVLRVLLQKAVNSAIETYRNSSRGKSLNAPLQTASTAADVSLRRLSKNTIDTGDTSSKHSFSDRLQRGSKGYLELEELVVDKHTGRVTTATPDSIPDATAEKASQWPLA